MDLETEVTDYFLFLLDLCKDPSDVFPCRSPEHRLAQSWLEKLCLLVCDDLNERRLRNKYLSQLCVCLNDKELKGPFLVNPSFEAKLDPNADFRKAGTPKFDCSIVPAIYEKCGVSGDEDKSERGFINCSLKKPDDMNMISDRGKEEPAKAKEKEPETPAAPKKEEKVTGYMYREIHSSPDYFELFGDPKSKPNLKKSEPLGNDVTSLLSAISCELRGEHKPGSNEFLECELVRYKEFLTKHSDLAGIVISESSPAKLRSFLLVNLQNDLVKLLSENSMDLDEDS